MSEQQVNQRTKEQYLADVRDLAAAKGLDEAETALIERIAVFMPTKKIASELNCTEYRVRKNVQAFKEKLGLSGQMDVRLMGVYLLSITSKDTEVRDLGLFLCSYDEEKEGETA